MDNIDPKKKIKAGMLLPDDPNESGTGGQGGQSGKVQFRNFIGGEHFRDDLLSPTEQKRLLIVHRDSHEARVETQKTERENRAAIKEGKFVQKGTGLAGAGQTSQFKAHPHLMNQAQFSGTSKQVTQLTTDNTAEINASDREELRLRLGHAPEQAPRFNPRPQYR